MRRPRLKPDDIPMFYHLYNRVAGEPDHFPFGPAEKEKFVHLLHRLQKFFTVEVVAYQVMSNHFHLLVHAPEDTPSPEEVVRRYAEYHGGRQTIAINDPLCDELGQRMRDISWFMHALQQQFAAWYNRSRTTPRRGGLWAQRFKHTLLGGAEAVWACWKYIEMNPVRAGIVTDPADYRFSTYGAWSGKGRYPFEQNLKRRILPILQGIYPYASVEQILLSLRHALCGAGSAATRQKDDLSETITMLDRRTRFWVDGLVIGSAVFLRDIIARSSGILKHGSKRSRDRLGDPHSPFCIYNAPNVRS